MATNVVRLKKKAARTQKPGKPAASAAKKHGLLERLADGAVICAEETMVRPKHVAAISKRRAQFSFESMPQDTLKSASGFLDAVRAPIPQTT